MFFTRHSVSFIQCNLEKKISSHNKILLGIFFLIFFIPFISHIYNTIFAIIYFHNISLIGSLLFFLSLVCAVKFGFRWQKDFIYFLPFLILSVVESFLAGHFYFVKYFGYIFIYFTLNRFVFFHSYFFKIFLYTIGWSLIFLLVLFFFVVLFGFDQIFLVKNMASIFSNAPILETYSRAVVYGVLIFDYADTSSIFGINRFYGFSREPGFLVMFSVPCLFMALLLGCRKLAAGFALVTCFASSYAGFLVLICLVPLYFVSARNWLLGLLCTLCVFHFFRQEISSAFAEGDRVKVYIGLYDEIWEGLIFASGNFNDIHQLLWFLKNLSILLLHGPIIRECFIRKNKLLIAFCFSFVALLFKGSEVVSPLFLFYLGFVTLFGTLAKQSEKNSV